MKVAFVSQPIDSVLPPSQNSIGIWTYQVARHVARTCDVIVYTRGDHSFRKQKRYVEGVRYEQIPMGPDRLLHGLLRQLASIRPILAYIRRLAQLRSRYRTSLPNTARFHPEEPNERKEREGSGAGTHPAQNATTPFFASGLYQLGYCLQVAADLRAEGCDVVHLFNLSQFVPVIRAFNPGVKIVLHMQCEWLTQLDRAMIEQRLGQTDLVIGCSEYITEKIRYAFPQYAHRCRTVYNGVDTDHFASSAKHRSTNDNGAGRLLFVGRVSPEKGVHVLLDAFQQVIARFPEARLDIAGPPGAAPTEFIVPLSDDPNVAALESFFHGDYSSHLRDRLPSEVASRVWFTGNVPHAQLISHYRDADVFIFPSVWNEPFGIPVVEAMAMEVPVVATRGGGIVEIVEEGKTGLVVEPGNSAALAEAILAILTAPDRGQAIGASGRRRAVDLFSWERVVESLLCRYRDVGAPAPEPIHMPSWRASR